MNKLHEIIKVRHQAKALGTTLNVKKNDSFRLIKACIAFHGCAREHTIREFIALGYLRTNQLLNEMVATGRLDRTGNGYGDGYRYHINPFGPSINQ